MTKQTLKRTKKKKIAHTGFRVRMKTNSGRNIIKRRKDKGRNKIVP